MISVVSTLFLLLRWVLVIQSPFGVDFGGGTPLFLSEEQSNHQVELHFQDNSDFQSHFGFCENAEEEKEETEEEGSIWALSELIFQLCNPTFSGQEKTFSQSRPGKGSLHLYDFYHSWKIALS
ncbi:hypothetical protein [Algoriphagus confluentis]|uniref:Uncharacterized protein n=1 Tax=Algoriphagus confluentis TaxID=1697556 RepID=A0ABQ6PRJ7_9BACT|nr:hypothetical protein Aconfl_25030 [Algoriphagus confluentis]